MIVEAQCTYDARLSGPSKLGEGGFNFVRGKSYQLDLSDKEQRKLLTLTWKMGTRKCWVFEFDRAACNSGEAPFFCKEPGCGEPFENINELGTHSRSVHKAKRDKPVVEDEHEPTQEELLERAIAQQGA